MYVQCQGDLVCFRRKDTEDVPGCEFPGNGQRFVGMDVCVQPTNEENAPMPTKAEPDTPVPTFSSEPSLAPTTSPQPTAYPTPIGTNSWAQTWGMTDAFRFVGPPSTSAPTTEGERGQDWTWIFNFADPQPLQLVGNNGKGGPFPLGPCQADCDKDEDCAGPLQCMQRKQGGETVPGCFGRDETDEDYCIWPPGYNASQVQSDIQEVVAPTKWDNGFCLKLYW